MGDGIAKGVGQQIAELGKQIVSDVVKAPLTIAGLDQGGNVNETAGQGGQAKTQQTPQQAQQAKVQAQMEVAHLKQKDEVEKQKQLSITRQLLQQFQRPTNPEEMSVEKKKELEELELKKKEIEQQKEEAKKVLPQVASKAKRGNLYGVKQKKFGGELGKNVKSG